MIDVRQADFGPTPHRVNIGGQPVRPWIVMITSRTAHAIRNQASLALRRRQPLAVIPVTQAIAARTAVEGSGTEVAMSVNEVIVRAPEVS
jgi:hypothetical protein